MTGSSIRSVDAHAHLDKYDDGELASVVAGIEVDRILTISVSVDRASYERARSVSAQSRLIVPTFGIHPWEAPRFADVLDELDAWCASSPMIGEIGLDHRFVTDPGSHQAQRAVFATLVDIAVDVGKVVNVHSTGAERETAEMLRSRRVERAIIHWYAGEVDTLDRLVGCGYFVTVGCAVLHSAQIRDIATRIPDDQLLTETDNPGGQRSHTGRAGGPRLLRHIESELARLRRTSPMAVRALVRANLARLLRDDLHLESWRAVLDELELGQIG